MNGEKFTEIIKEIKNAGEILILTHQDPDGDGLGSMIILKEMINQLQPTTKVDCLVDEKYKKNLEYFVSKNNFTTKIKDNYDLIMALDTSELTRLSHKVERVDINIDHHADNLKFGKLNLVDDKAASVAVIMHDIIRENKLKISGIMAEAMYLAVYTDTGNFAFSNTDERAVDLAFQSVRAGADPHKIYKILYENLDLEEVKDFGEILQTTELILDGKCALALIKEKSSVDNRVVIDFIRRIKDIEVAVVLVEKEDFIKLSFRSTNEVDVSEFARYFSGGGHKKAAAGKITGIDLEEAKKEVVDYLKKNI